MTRKEFAHTIRAAAGILGVNELLVIGSQAIHASVSHPFPAAHRSIEADIALLDDKDGAMADLIDGAIGEASGFQEQYGYYAQGVEPSTAILPEGWRKRLVKFTSPLAPGVTALCLEPHDLWISKAMAGREKDREFCDQMISGGYVKIETLKERLKKLKGQPKAKIQKAENWMLK